MRIRLRGPSGATSIEISDDATWGHLRKSITSSTSIEHFELRHGYPPQLLGATLDDDIPLSTLDTPLHNAQLTIVPTTPPSPPPTASTPAAPLSLTRGPGLSETDIPTIPVPNLSSHLTLRVMPDDNSCLFRALSSALLGSSLDGMHELRSIVAQRIQAQPDVYSAAVLDKAPGAYCAWIQREDSWGGGIEMSILSQEFGVEIASVNVQDLRVDRFNEGKQRRVVLVYSGIHYDVCALTEGLGEVDEDRKVFEVLKLGDGEEDDGGVLDAARELCRQLRDRHYFTDTQRFSIKCNVCGWSGKGEREATQHATSTGHMDFGES